MAPSRCWARAHGVPLTHTLLLDMVVESDKQRFALSDDGQRIRAQQGHSLAIDLNLTPQTPPGRLFHGTATAAD
jgi:putative RNA 2'-phosphotransferase